MDERRQNTRWSLRAARGVGLVVALAMTIFAVGLLISVLFAGLMG